MRLIDADTFRRVLDTVYPFTKEEQRNHGMADIAKSGVLIALEKTPTITVPQWIPCSERLPEKEAYYLITYGGAVTWQHWLHNRWYGIGDPERVTAWMPLPAPFKED